MRRRLLVGTGLIIPLVVVWLDACVGSDPDFAAPLEAGAPRDGSGDATTAETSVAPGSVDAGGHAGDAAVFGCSQAVDATFCDDFDGLGLAPRWRPSTFGDGSAVQLVDGGLSFPSALGAWIPSGVDVAGAAVVHLASARSRIRVRGDFKVESFGAAEGDYVMLLAVTAAIEPLTGARVVAYPKTGIAYLSVVNQGTDQVLASREITGATFGDWTSVDLAVTLEPAVSATLQLGASRVATDVDASSTVAPPTVTVQAGIPLGSSTLGATRVLVDNVAAWIE